MTATVSALLVCSDGARWLPAVLRHLEDQSVLPHRLVAVDTGSSDRTPHLLADALGSAAVVDAPDARSFGAAVRAGLALLPPAGPEEWVWLLHDDAAPAADALERLVEAREAHPGVDVFGPKLREWPSLRRLLEVGATVGPTGHRETALERGEYDQGQHDDPRDVLAVNTAGMLVRRDLLEKIGFDPALPVTHADLDFGWRVARAGGRVRSVPAAVLFHAEATRTGRRLGQQRPAARHRDQRRAELYTVLANASGRTLPLTGLRLFLGSLLRALGLLLVRAPAAAWGELQALGAVFGRPVRLLAARRARRRTAVRPHAEVRSLLAPWWTPYRHGLDELTDLGQALLRDLAGASASRRAGRELPPRQRLLRSPALLLLVLLTVSALVAARSVWGSGPLAGAALLPAPGSALDWWGDHFSTGHDLGVGSVTTAPAYVLPLAALATVLAGSASLAVDVVVLGAVPLAFVGAYRCLLHLSGGRVVSAWGAATYALSLVLAGVVGQGRVGTLVVALVLPWLTVSAAGMLGAEPDRRRRAAWRATGWLALAAAFAPVVWLLAALLTLLGLGVLLSRGGRGGRDRRAIGALLLPVLAAPVLLLPWSALVWGDRGLAALLLEAGEPGPSLLGPLGPVALLAFRPAEAAAGPVWVGLVVPLLALAALARASTRRRVLAAWSVALVGLLATAVLGRLTVAPGEGAPAVPVWLGVPLLVTHAAWLAAAVLAGVGLREELRGATFGLRQVVGTLLAGAAVTATVTGLGWWWWQASGPFLERGPADVVPVYMQQAAERDPALGTLVLRGELDATVTHELVRRPGPRLGDEGMRPSYAAQAGLTGAVADLLTQPGDPEVAAVAAQGVRYVYAAEPVDPALATRLDSAPGLVPASADRPEARAWRVEQETTYDAPASARTWLRPLLLILQGLALVTVLVLAAPTRRRGR